MALTKIKLGKLISVVDERNTYDIKDFYGININKEFIPTVADTEGLNESNYKVVRKNRFVFSGMQTGRDECIRISIYLEEKPIIVSPAYTTFEIKDTDVVLPTYFFMLFLSKERDRLGWFYSDSSIRSNLDWVRFCDIEIELPDLPTQQKYVDIYNTLVANQQSYERGLDDLKLVCDGYIEDLRRQMPCEKIGKYIKECNEKNDRCLTLEHVRGIATSKDFIDTKANMDGVSLSNYKIVNAGEIAFISDTSRRGEKISLALNSSQDTFLVSAISTIFKTDQRYILPEYLMLFFKRDEFDRYARFNSWGSARENFSFDEMQNVEIPIPDISIQQSIIDIYHVYMTRKSINEKLKAQIKNICPILIRGSLEEGREIK